MEKFYSLLEKININPHHISTIGVWVTCAGAGIATLGNDAITGLSLFIVGRALDILDGPLARHLQKKWIWGPHMEWEKLDAHGDKVAIYLSLLLLLVQEQRYENMTMVAVIWLMLLSDGISTYLRQNTDWQMVKEWLTSSLEHISTLTPRNSEIEKRTENAANFWWKAKATLQTAWTGIWLAWSTLPYWQELTIVTLGLATAVSVPSLIQKISTRTRNRQEI